MKKGPITLIGHENGICPICGSMIQWTKDKTLIINTGWSIVRCQGCSGAIWIEFEEIVVENDKEGKKDK